MSKLIPVVQAGKCRVFATAMLVVTVPTIGWATDLSAGVIMEKMSAGDRYTFVAGIVEGLAIARYRQDGNKPGGMNCIYDWFYNDHATLDNIYAAFQRYPTYAPGAVIDAMVRKKCT